MEWIVADLKIAVVLLAWIVAMVGIGNVVYNIINSRKTKANSSLGNHCIDLANFEHSQTHSLASRPKFSKEAKAPTADTRILGEMQGDSAKDSADSIESNAESSENNPVIASETKQSIKSCEAQPNLAPLRGAKKEKQGGSSASALLELEAENSEALPLKAKKRIFLARRGSGEEGAALFAKKSDYVNENISAESRWSERVESAESHTESNAESLKDSSDSIESNHNMDLQVWVSCGRNARHANPCGLSRNDEQKTTLCKNTISCNDGATLRNADSRNDENMANLHEVVLDSRNDDSAMDSHEDIASCNDDFKPRHCEGAKQPKQSILQHQKSSDFADSSDFTQSPTIFPDNFAIRIFASLLFGVIIVSFLTSLLHLFIPITPIVSIAFLALGIALFALKIRDFHLLDFRVLFSGAVAFAIVAILGFFHDSIGDSVNYHIQIVTWIQNSPLIFGLGNIHGRLGFNGIIYNFYALSDVSQIFPTLRSFIANEIIYFAFIFAVVYILATGAFRRFYLLFIVCCAIPFSFVLKWAEFNALHCEGIGLVFGVFVGAMVCYVVGNQRKHEQNANSSLGNHCIDLANFEHSLESRLASRPKFSKEAKAPTADTRILGETQSDSADSIESNAESLESSLRGDLSPKQSKKSCEAQPPLAPLRGAKKEKQGGRSASALLELEAENSEALPLKAKKRSFLARRGSGEEGAALFAKKSDYVNENISAESRRSERVESAESHTESNAESLKDSSDSVELNHNMDCHDSATQNLAMTAKGDSVEFSEKIKMDLQVWVSCGRNARHANPCGLSRNDEQKTTLCKNTNSRNDGATLRNADSRNDASPTSSLRGDLSPKQSIDSIENDFKDSMDCHDWKLSLKPHKPTMTKPTHFANALLFILFIMSVFAAQVKIANTALCLCVAIIFIYLNRDFYRTKFYKKYVILGVLCVIFVLPWAIKGVATSGMVAYPAGLFFFESLPFAVSEAQRESEVCWIMSWARAPGKNCVEVLSNSAWVGEWFSMKTRYFGWYFKHFVYNFFASLALLIAIIIYAKAQKRRIDSAKYLIVFLAMFAGAIFWFFSGPDPRFGMVYIFPLIGILLAFNITEIKNIASKKARIVFIVALLLTLMPFWKLTRDMYIILILLCVLLPSLSAKWRKFYYALLVVLSFVSIPNIYRKQLGSIKQLPKVLPIYAKEQITDYGVSVFHRSDELKEGYKAYDYEPMPTTPYFSSHIKEERFLGRKAYINANKESK